ncbi:MAG: PKD domain-containing protein [Verrucomicrobia bacterium]|nr:PKD domain-containing protein [Verrucomicrobiota bacterium]
MFKSRWFFLGSLLVAGLLAVVFLRPRSAPRPEVVVAPVAVPVAQPVVAAAEAVLSVAPKTVLEKFSDWSARYVAARPEDRAGLVAEGLKLAQERRGEMLKLIKNDPQTALEQAVPYGVRKRLPEEVKAELEQPVSGHGSYEVIIFRPLPGHEGEQPPTERKVKIKGQKFDAYVYGWRSQLMSKQDIAMHGVGIGSALAMSSDAARTVSPEEAADLVAAGKAKVDPVCSVSGQPSVTAGLPVLLDLGTGQFQTVCGEHPGAVNDSVRFALQLENTSKASAARRLAVMNHLKVLSPSQLGMSVQAFGGGGGGSTNPPVIPPGLLGQRRLLLIPVQYLDEAAPPFTQQAIQTAGQAVHNFYNRASFGYEQVVATVTPTVVLPYREWVYDEGYLGSGYLSIVNDAVVQANLLGYDESAFDYYYVIATSIPSANYGGISYHLSFGTGSLNHEIGHNTGLGHAHFFDNGRPPGPTQPNPALPIDPDSSSTANNSVGHADINAPYIAGIGGAVGGGSGSILDYGDPWDTMGSGGSDFGAPSKANIGWLPPQFIRTITTGETNRIYAFDGGSVTNGRLYALRTRRNQTWGDFWISHRHAIANNPYLLNGVILQDGSPTLFDTTGGTPDGRNDSAIVVGRTFSDPEARVHITPIANAGTGADAWVDVVVQRGDFPGNNAPVIASLLASAVSVAQGTPVTFTATASDADGDALAYYFTFGDDSFGTNSATNVHTFATNGQYVVRCEVSDMKGGLASANLLVTVGSPGSFAISGRVTDPNGLPVQGVRIHNGVAPPGDSGTGTPINAGGYSYGYTDSDGYYIVPDLGAGTYTMGAFLYRNRTLPLNFNGLVTVNSANVTDVNFTATPIQRVTVDVVTNAIEGGAPGVFRVSRDGPTTNDLRVKVALSTPDGAGFTPAALANIIIPTGSAFTNINITGLNNAVGDGGRHVRLTLSLVTNYIVISSFLTNSQFVLRTNNILSPGWEILPRLSDNADVWYQTYPNYVIDNAEATMLVVDDDPPGTPTVSVTAGNTGVVEGSSDVANFVFRRTSAPLTNDLIVNFSLTGTASNGADYVTVPGTVILPAGQSVVAVPIVPINNYFVDGDRTVVATVQAGAGYNASASTATVTIVDDDLTSIGVYASDPFAGRGGGNNGTFTFTRHGDLTRPVLVNYLASGTAVANSDYTTLSGSVNIPAGAISATVTVVPTALPSSPGPKTVVVTISDSPSYNTHGQGRATVKISDVVPTVTVANSGNAAEGGGNGGFNITSTGSTANPLTVFFNLGGYANPNTDYSGIGTNVVIPAGSATVNIPIVANDDNFREFTATGQNNARLNEHEFVQLALIESDTYDIGGSGTASVTITDNDGAAFPGVSFITQTTTVREDAGTISIPVRIGGNPTNNALLPVVVTYAVTGGTAVRTVNYDYAFPNPDTLLFISNRVVTGGFEDLTQQIQFLDLDIFDDGVITGDRTIILNLGYYTNFITNIVVGVSTNIIPYPTNFVLGDYRTHTIIIKDTDSAVVDIAALTTLAYEQGQVPGVFRLTRTGTTNASLKVNLLVSGTAVNGIDYTNIASSVTFAPGAKTVDILVTPFDDVEQEPAETVVLTIAESPGMTIGTNSATVVIVDNDGTVQFTFATYEVNEAATNAVIDVLRTGATNLLSKVDYVFNDGTASNGLDYLGTNGTLTFNPGEVVKQIIVPIVNDLIVEPTETFSITLTNATGGVPLGGQFLATVSIVDDDIAFVFKSPTFSAYEDGTNAVITVYRLGVTNAAVSVDFSTADGTASNLLDYTGQTNTLTFNPGVTNLTVLIPVIDDVLMEGDETVNLALANPSPGATIGAISNAVLTIVDDEAYVEFSSTTYSVLEYAGQAALQIRRVGGTEHPINVSYYTTDGTASNGLDYVAVANTITLAGDSYVLLTNGSGQTVFVRGETNRTIFIPILDDTLGEGNETFLVTVGSVAGVSNVVMYTNTFFSDSSEFRFPIATLKSQGTLVINYDFFVQPDVLRVYYAGGLIFDSGSVANSGTFTVPFGPGLTNGVEIVMNEGGNPVPNASWTYTVAVVTASTTVAGPNSNAVVTIIDDEQPGYVDYQFNTGAGANAPVLSASLDFAQNKVVIGGAFTTVDSNVLRHVARLTPLGAVDQSFNPGAGANSNVNSVFVQPDGKVLVGGEFTTMDGSNRVRVARLGADGNVDPGFTPGVGPNNSVRAVAVQADGLVLIGGDFTAVAGNTNFHHLARLLTNGVLDTNFVTSVSNTVLAIVPLTNGSILVGGAFTNVGATLRPGLAQFLTNGTPDGSFDPGADADGPVRALAVQPDGRIVVGGSFTLFNGNLTNRLVRLTAGGAVDPGFNTGSGADGDVNAVALDPTGKIFIGGAFSNFNGSPLAHYARLRAAGAVDIVFNAGSGADAVVNTAVIQTNSGIIIGGAFTNVNNVPRPGVARIHGDEKSVIAEVELDFASYTILENAGPLNVTLTRRVNTNLAFAIGVVTTDGTATNGTDFTGGLYVVNFAAGQTNANFNLPILDNLAVDGDRTFFLSLTNAPNNVAFPGVSNATVTIINDDSYVQFSAATNSVIEGFTASVVVTRIGRLALPATVVLQTGGGTATSGFDYSGVTNTVSFAPGETAQTNFIQTYNDTILVGPLKTVGLTLVNPTNVLVGTPGAQTLTIVDNPSAISFAATNFSGLEGFSIPVVIQRTGFTNFAVSCLFVTGGGTAASGADYTGVTNAVSFAPGETLVTNFIQTYNDTILVGALKTVGLTLLNPTNIALGPPSVATLTIQDNPSAISFTATNFSGNEGTNIAVVITRTGFTNFAVACSFATGGGTAVSGTDYLGLTNVLLFAPGETLATNFIQTFNGYTFATQTKTVGLTLGNPTNIALGPPAVATLLILDDPSAVTFSSPTNSVVEGTNAVITVTRGGQTNLAVSVWFRTTGGTATAGVDYTGQTNLLLFAPGVTTQTVLIPTVEDFTPEPGGETVGLQLFGATNIAIGPFANATLTINDFAPFPGAIDRDFDSSIGANDLVRSVAVEPNGHILIGGGFTKWNNSNRLHVARVLTNGALDTTFAPGYGADAVVSAIAVLPTARIMIGVAFTNVNSNVFNHLARLGTNGLPDFTFNPPGSLDAALNAIAVQTNGQMILGGGFHTPLSGVMRLTTNATVDPAFLIGTGANGPVHALAVDVAGRTYLGGGFTSVNGFPAARVARLLPNGAVDTNFVPAAITNGVVFALAVEPDGRLFIGGEFTSVGGTNRGRVARLNGNGSLDLTFNPGTGAGGAVYALALQPNGRVVVAGDFTNFNGTTVGRIARVEEDGSLDVSFSAGHSGADAPVYALAVTFGGGLVLGGDFTTVNDAPRHGVALLYGDPPVQLVSGSVVSNGFFVTLGTLPGGTYAIDYSDTFFGPWTPLVTNFALGTSLTFTDTNAPAFPTRAYRARLLVP